MKKFAAHGPMIEVADDTPTGYYRIVEVDRTIAKLREEIATLQQKNARLHEIIDWNEYE